MRQAVLSPQDKLRNQVVAFARSSRIPAVSGIATALLALLVIDAISGQRLSNLFSIAAVGFLLGIGVAVAACVELTEWTVRGMKLLVVKSLLVILISALEVVVVVAVVDIAQGYPLGAYSGLLGYFVSLGLAAGYLVVRSAVRWAWRT